MKGEINCRFEVYLLVSLWDIWVPGRMEDLIDTISVEVTAQNDMVLSLVVHLDMLLLYQKLSKQSN